MSLSSLSSEQDYQSSDEEEREEGLEETSSASEDDDDVDIESNLKVVMNFDSDKARAKSINKHTINR